MAGDVLLEVLQPFIDLVEGALEQRVPAQSEDGRPVQVGAHLLELAARDALDVHDADTVVGLDGLDEGLDLPLLPLGNVFRGSFGFGRHLRPPRRRGQGAKMNSIPSSSDSWGFSMRALDIHTHL